MRIILKLACAAFLVLGLQACKPTLSPTKIAEEDYYATVTLKCVVLSEFQSGDWQPLDVTPSPVVTIRRSFDGREYSIPAPGGKLTKTFGLGKVEKDQLSLTVDNESILGHYKGTAFVEINANEESELIEIKCKKQKE